MESNNPLTHDNLSDFSAELDNLVVHEDATRGQRFLNFVIDIICGYAFAFLVIIIISIISPGFLEYFQQDGVEVRLADRLVTTLLIVTYYILIEGFTGGRSVGKFVTGTKAITIDGEPMTWGTVVKRNFCRMVPLEPLSGFGTPLHDSWTNTQVVKVKK